MSSPALVAVTTQVPALVLVSVVPLTLMLGAVFAFWLRGRRPETYARVGDGGDEVRPSPAVAPEEVAT